MLAAGTRSGALGGRGADGRWFQ